MENHYLTVENRERLTVSQVVEVDAFDENSNGVLDENEKENLPQLKFIAYAVQYAGFEDKPADAWAVIPDEEKD